MEAILYDGNKVIAKSNSVDFAVNKKSDEDYIYGGRDKYKIYPYIKKSSWFEIELKDMNFNEDVTSDHFNKFYKLVAFKYPKNMRLPKKKRLRKKFLKKYGDKVVLDNVKITQ